MKVISYETCAEAPPVCFPIPLTVFLREPLGLLVTVDKRRPACEGRPTAPFQYNQNSQTCKTRRWHCLSPQWYYRPTVICSCVSVLHCKLIILFLLVSSVRWVHVCFVVEQKAARHTDLRVGRQMVGGPAGKMGGLKDRWVNTQLANRLINMLQAFYSL